MYRIRMPVFPFRATSETAAAWQLGFPPSPFCACRQAAPPTRLPLYKFIMNQAPELLLKSLKFPKVLPEFMPTRYQILIRKQLGELGLRRAVCSQTHGFNRIRGGCTIKRQTRHHPRALSVSVWMPTACACFWDGFVLTSLSNRCLSFCGVRMFNQLIAMPERVLIQSQDPRLATVPGANMAFKNFCLFLILYRG